MPTFIDVYLDFYSAIVCTIRITADNEKKYASVILFVGKTSTIQVMTLHGSSNSVTRAG